MGNSVSAEMADKMRPLRLRYFGILKQRMGSVQKAVDLMRANSFDGAADRAELQSEAHKLAGTGSTYGFPRISEAARALENTLISNQKDGQDVLLNLTIDLLIVCQETLATATEGSSPASSA